MTKFSEAVIATIKKIPKGRVATYGQIAKLAGSAHAARGVSWILSSSSRAHKLPWHRVLNSKGTISFPSLSEEYARQRRLLLSEGIELSEAGRVDLKKYGFKRPASRPKS